MGTRRPTWLEPLTCMDFGCSQASMKPGRYVGNGGNKFAKYSQGCGTQPRNRNSLGTEYLIHFKELRLLFPGSHCSHVFISTNVVELEGLQQDYHVHTKQFPKESLFPHIRVRNTSQSSCPSNSLTKAFTLGNLP